MDRESKKRSAEQAAEEKPKSLEQLILDRTHGKYALVSLAASWALVLRRREENRHLSQQEVLDLALLDVLAGKVAPEEVREQAAVVLQEMAAAGMNGKTEKK